VAFIDEDQVSVKIENGARIRDARSQTLTTTRGAIVPEFDDRFACVGEVDEVDRRRKLQDG
jgi:hypothetical protein